MSPEPRSSSLARWIAILAATMAACATPSPVRTPDGRAVQIVSAPPPGCRLVGPVVGEHPGFLSGRSPVGSESNRQAAEAALLKDAARKGATHVVVTSTDYYGTNLTDATMSGKGYECP